MWKFGIQIPTSDSESRSQGDSPNHTWSREQTKEIHLLSFSEFFTYRSGGHGSGLSKCGSFPTYWEIHPHLKMAHSCPKIRGPPQMKLSCLPQASVNCISTFFQFSFTCDSYFQRICSRSLPADGWSQPVWRKTGGSSINRVHSYRIQNLGGCPSLTGQPHIQEWSRESG